MLGRNIAAHRMLDLPLTIGCAFDDVPQTFTEVSFNRAHVNLKLLGKRVFVNGFALVQAGQNLRQTLRQLFAFGLSACRIEKRHEKTPGIRKCNYTFFYVGV